MVRLARSKLGNEVLTHILLTLLLLTTIQLGWSYGSQADNGPSQVGEGSLLYRSPVSGRYESVPLVHTDAAVDVRGLVAAATVTQQYANSTPEPIEAVYVFPLPHDAAVYDMEIHIGNRVIRSVARERQEAKRVYEAAKSTGKRAALLEEERPNIFTTSIANIMPGDRIDVRMRYVEPLRWEGDRMRLVFPMVVGPRYIPGTQPVGHAGNGWASDTDAVPDASRITPPVRNPESRSGHDISVAVDLDSGFETASLKCVSHEISVHRLADGRQHVELATRATLPNKDFVLEVKQADSTQPKTALFLSPAKDSGETHFLLAAFPPTVQPGVRMPIEMLYMIDVSGSMEGTSIQQARGALLEALDRLRPSDRFGILAFSSGYREFSPEPLPASAENLAAARRYVQGLQAGGGTEMLPALLHLMRKPISPDYLRHIILLTDGDLGNEEQIFAALRSDLGNSRLYTIAIGSAPNLFLATKMVQFGRGTFTHIADISEIQEKVAGLLESIESPVLTDVKLTFAGVEIAEVYPEHTPDLFLHQPLLISGRVSKGLVGTVHLTARAGNEPYETTIAFDASKATFHPGITTLWARQRVEDLMDHWRHSDEKGQAEIRASVIAHAIRYRLVTRFTSLVAVEQVIVNPGGHSNTAAVPTELPAGWQMEKVFGAPATGTADSFLEAVGLISSDPEWTERVKGAAEASWERVRNLPEWDQPLSDQTVKDLLAPLRELVCIYELFALAVASYEDRDTNQLMAFVEHAAYSSGHHAIFLSTNIASRSSPLSILDPFQGMALIAEQPENWPGVLFWSRTSTAAFAKLADAYELYEQLRKIFASPNSLSAIDDILKDFGSRSHRKKLLHLSDVHFGNADAANNEAYLMGHLDRVLDDVDRVVVTGDLFNEPRREQAIAFRNFRASLQRRTGKNPIVIPGNHDQKWLGNLGSPLRELANLEWSSLVLDDELKLVFFCFDSSRDADLARGKITKQQMLDIATQFVTECSSRRWEIEEYMSIALVHHHPFSFETNKETMIQRGLARVGITDELFLQMEDAESFISWCARRAVPLILHGHKHVPRYVKQSVSIDRASGPEEHEVVAVGCGSSLGAEGKPLSYNLLSWDPRSERWSVSFFADPGDGGGFSQQFVALHSAPTLTVWRAFL